MIMVNVLYKSLIQLLQFLLGCLPVYLGFWIFGMCFWGHLSEIFASPLTCASYLFCVMHGDSILAFYNNVIIQNDYSPYFGFFYGTLWVIFGLILMFNITISIVQAVLNHETKKAQKRSENSNTNLFLPSDNMSPIIFRTYS